MSDFAFKELAIRYETLKELVNLTIEIIPESTEKQLLVKSFNEVIKEENDGI